MDVVLPKWGVSMQEGTVLAWLVEEGGSVTEGQPIVEIETDKINAEIESPADGVLATHVAQVGSTVEVGAVIAVIDV